MRHTPKIFYDSSCRDVSFDDYLLLGGGTDINPKIYKQEPLPQTQFPDMSRDARNIIMIDTYVKMGKPIFGICRGFQLLDAVFGGQLIQHAVGHQPGGWAKVYLPASDEGNTGIESFANCRSCHHQIVEHRSTKGQILGFSTPEYTAYNADGSTRYCSFVPQIIYWEEKKALAVQFHPEWHFPDHAMNVYLRGLIKDLLGLENVL